MIAYVDIENAKTKDVITLELKVINKDGEDISFDISCLDKITMEALCDAINPELKYTDIEMFYLDDSSIPNYGPDYQFSIKGAILYGVYVRNDFLEKRRKENERTLGC